MKKQLKSILLIVSLMGIALPSWGQASTQGKEFWVSSTIVCSPDNTESKRTPNPYIAISAEKACTISIQGGNGINITQSVGAGSWNEFGNTSKSYNNNPTTGPINVQMDASKWYPTQINASDQVRTLAGQKNMYGLHITATENISVYVILSTLNSMDASNILPVTALGSEYYTQDFWPIVKSDWNNTVTMTTILATESGTTTVRITPNGKTYDGKPSGIPYTVDLVQGQTYYLMSEADKQLTGTHIEALGKKKIAIFNGVPLTNLPTNVAARDGLFEQSMPIEYWGTQFIVTRSLEKDGNLIGITATQPNTKIKVDGIYLASIGMGDTYYIMLQSANDPNANKPGTNPVDQVITGDALYIETSCPCAVYSYDTGRDYKGKTATEVQGTHGDPSSVWVSPIQQKIGKITFGTCYTEKTKDHFLNVVTETATCQNTKLTAIHGATQLDKTSLLTWQTVPGNPTYSYARAKIGEASTSQFSVFDLENARGFTATIYGNGDDESYAYSAGSAAVEQGINVNGVTFTNGYRSDEKFCFTDSVEFDAAVGTDEIKRVDWDFGDGTTLYNGPVQTKHQYTAPGWYEVTARLFGHQVCTDDPDVDLGAVSFTFRIWRPDTIIGGAVHECLTLAQLEADPTGCAEKLAKGANDTLPQVNCYDDVVINLVNYGKETFEKKDTIVGQDIAYGYNGKPYYVDTNVEDTTSNEFNCPHYIRYHVHVKTCLGITMSGSNLHICPGEDLYVDYVKSKGDIKNPVHFVVPGVIDETFDMDNGNTQIGSLPLPTSTVTTPGYYKGTLTIEDANECDPLVIPINFAIYYPSNIFKYKFNNVLAVYQPGYGGNTGYEFTGYQWYCNGHPIPGATEAVYHTDSAFKFNDIYFVELTDANGVTIRSCDQHITDVPIIPEHEATESARKMMMNQRIVIRKGEKIYDIYGQRVQ